VSERSIWTVSVIFTELKQGVACGLTGKNIGRLCDQIGKLFIDNHMINAAQLPA
jgi:hypothetical protein